MKYPHNKFQLPEGLDSKYWSRYSYYTDSKGEAHSILVYELATNNNSKTKADAQTWTLRCGICRKLASESACKCVKHVCGTYFSTLSIGKCNDEQHCTQCCTCYVCKKCNKLFKSTTKPGHLIEIKNFCMTCMKCTSCCTCTTCYNCGLKVKTPCACGENHHANCCDSNERLKASPSKLIHIKRIPRFHTGSDFQRNRCRRFLSIESEVDNFTDRSKLLAVNSIAKKWGMAVVYEGTCPDGGELCLAPASGDLFLEQISDLLDAYASSKPTVGVRCGMHVHVDATDFVYEDLQNLTALYERIEFALFSMLPPWRRISRFVTPCGDLLEAIIRSGANLTGQVRSDLPDTTHTKASGIASKMAEKLYGRKNLAEVRKVHKDQNNQRVRYMALNLHSWLYRKTFEFRHWPGTTSLEEMSLWPQVVGTIVEFAKRTSLNEIKRLPKHPLEALEIILTPSTWCSNELWLFCERLIARWSPDFETVLRILTANKTKNWCVAIPKIMKDDYYGPLGIGFDMQNMLFTYLRENHINWTTQWLAPVQGTGRYAGLNDVGDIKDVSYIKQSNETMYYPAKPPKTTYDELF